MKCEDCIWYTPNEPHTNLQCVGVKPADKEHECVAGELKRETDKD